MLQQLRLCLVVHRYHFSSYKCTLQPYR